MSLWAVNLGIHRLWCRSRGHPSILLTAFKRVAQSPTYGIYMKQIIIQYTGTVNVLFYSRYIFTLSLWTQKLAYFIPADYWVCIHNYPILTSFQLRRKYCYKWYKMLNELIMTHHHICPNMYGLCNFRFSEVLL